MSTTLSQDHRALLFADQSLEELQSVLNDDSAQEGEWTTLFRNAYKAVQAGDGKAARDYLKAITKMRSGETRRLLWAWNALRDLGEMPDKLDEKMIQGVILDIPVNGRVETMVVYRDGTAYYYNGKIDVGKGIISEKPRNDPSIDILIKGFLDTAAPYPCLNARRMRKHQLDAAQVYRLSLLTFSGLYVIETANPREIGPILDAGARLLNAIANKRAA